MASHKKQNDDAKINKIHVVTENYTMLSDEFRSQQQLVQAISGLQQEYLYRRDQAEVRESLE
jgi:hypothetical protein